MKKILFFLVLFFSGTLLLAQSKEVNFTSKIKDVTVFPNSAQVKRTAKGSVPIGTENLVFTGISPSIDASSIQFRAKGDFIILSVSHKLNYIKPKEEPEGLQKLLDEKKNLKASVDIEKAKLSALTEEESMVLANKQIKGQNASLSAEELAKMAQFFRNHLQEVKIEKLEVNKEITRLNEELSKVTKQINELNAANTSKATSEIIVAIQAEKKTQGEFDIEYVVHQAGWQPVYDLRVKDTNNPVKMTYKAKVVQSSGEDWSNIKLNLATGNPTSSGTKPTLNPWWLAQQVVYTGVRSRNAMKKEAALPQADAYEYEIADEAPAGYAAVEQTERTTFTEFSITLPQTIPSDGKPYTVNIADHELPADYIYYAVPKKDKNAFLTARITGWEDYDLLSGEASLFFEGTYLGKSWIDVASSVDTLSLSLGRDAGIVIKREKDRQFKDKQFIGRKVTRTIGWKIELRNTKSQEVNIIIEDQYPISTTDQIEVVLENSKGAKVETNTGKLTWEINLKPGKTEKLGFKYSVKYPKDMHLVLE